MTPPTQNKNAYIITTAWCSQDGETPWLLDAYDEISEENWGCTPDHFDNALTKARKDGAVVHVVNLAIDYAAIERLFAAKTIPAEVKQ